MWILISFYVSYRNETKQKAKGLVWLCNEMWIYRKDIQKKKRKRENTDEKYLNKVNEITERTVKSTIVRENQTGFHDIGW